MGSSASKPETKVFTPAAPIDFSASFLSQLEASKETDFSRGQHTQKTIQQSVKAELAKLEQETIKQFHAATDNALVDEIKPDDISVGATSEKLQSLQKLLQNNIELTKVDVSPEVAAARTGVINCLKQNDGKSLNCWEEVATFKQLVKDL